MLACLKPSSIERPKTYCPPIIRIACITAERTIGSLKDDVSSFIQLAGRWVMSGSSCTILPVSIIPQVAALTKSELEWPAWPYQSPLLIFSAISRSILTLSGTRKSASAKHIKATPSLLESPNSKRKESNKL